MKIQLKTGGVPPSPYFHCNKKKIGRKRIDGGLTPPSPPNPKPAMKADAHAPLIYIRVAFIATQIKICTQIGEMVDVSHPYTPYRVRLSYDHNRRGHYCPYCAKYIDYR